MVLSKSVNLLRFVPAVDVALCLLIALEIIKKNKKKALLLFFSTNTSTSLFSAEEKPLLVGSEQYSMCAHQMISDRALLPPAKSLITLLRWYFVALFNELVGRELAK